MRIIAGLIVLLLCTAWGFGSSAVLRRRCVLLGELRLLLEHYSIGISCAAETLEELAAGGRGEFAQHLRKCAAEETDMRKAWARAVKELSGRAYCGEEELAILSELGEKLGTCSAEGQLSLLRLYSVRLDRLYGQATENADKKGRLYRSGGILAGAAAAVLLL